MKFNTKVVHSGVHPDPSTGAIMTPIYQTSTYVQDAPAVHKGYEYSRSQNPTRDALEASLADLESGRYALTYATGLAAMDNLLKLFRQGDEIITGNDLYGGSYRIFTKVFEKYGIVFHFVDMRDEQNVLQHINQKTKMIWIETPTNPLMQLVDIKKMASIAKQHNILCAVDNTFASPYLQNPLLMGADIVMHSLTKFINGHSDVVMGALIMNDEALYKDLRFLQNACGAVPGPQDCFLVLRGIKTLAVRMDRHCSNGQRVAAYLAAHKKVKTVYYPGLETHNQHQLAKEQMRDFGSMMSFVLYETDFTKVVAFIKQLKIIALAESLGGVESLITHPASMTHASIPAEIRHKNGVEDGLLRLSIGIEDGDDIIEDLENALSTL